MWNFCLKVISEVLSEALSEDGNSQVELLSQVYNVLRLSNLMFLEPPGPGSRAGITSPLTRAVSRNRL